MVIRVSPKFMGEQLDSLDGPDNISINQMGGKVTLPFVDDLLIDNYLKIVGLYHIPLTTGTLLPLGVLIVIYQLYRDKIQAGGYYPDHPTLLMGVVGILTACSS